jgi:hypothetical protein
MKIEVKVPSSSRFLWMSILSVPPNLERKQRLVPESSAHTNGAYGELSGMEQRRELKALVQQALV